MKNLIFALLFLPLAASCQQQRTARPGLDTNNILIGYDVVACSPVTIRYDTIPAILLTSDTSYKWTETKDGQFYQVSNRVAWQHGYIMFNPRLCGYLDNDKKPFRNGIVIWDYKTK